MLQQQQGDVNITEIAKIPTEAKKKKDSVLAEGEATGHSHRVEGEAELLELGERLFLRVLGGDVRVVHEEHAPQIIPPGNYEITPTNEIMEQLNRSTLSHIRSYVV